MAAKIVVDTSVLIKWIKTKDEELVNEARRLLTEIERRPLEVHVPALLLYEVGNILLLKTDLESAGLNEAISDLEALPFAVAPPATPKHVVEIPRKATHKILNDPDLIKEANRRRRFIGYQTAAQARKAVDAVLAAPTAAEKAKIKKVVLDTY